jgi:hypothetical protein
MESSDPEQAGFVMHDTTGTDSKVAIFNNVARGFFTGLGVDLKLTVLSHTVFIGCVTESSFNEDKAKRFLEDLRVEFSKMYQGRLSLIKKQTNLT